MSGATNNGSKGMKPQQHAAGGGSKPSPSYKNAKLDLAKGSAPQGKAHAKVITADPNMRHGKYL